MDIKHDGRSVGNKAITKQCFFQVLVYVSINSYFIIFVLHISAHVGHRQGGPFTKVHINGTCQERCAYMVYRQYYVLKFYFRWQTNQMVVNIIMF
jgi:hypothetical protein